jgi:hypothetical protein
VEEIPLAEHSDNPELSSDADGRCGKAEADLLLLLWDEIAAVAWHGFQTSGRGFIRLVQGKGTSELRYQPGSPDEALQTVVAQYSPETEALVAIENDDGGVLVSLEGLPRPCDAASSAPLCRATLH